MKTNPPTRPPPTPIAPRTSPAPPNPSPRPAPAVTSKSSTAMPPASIAKPPTCSNIRHSLNRPPQSAAHATRPPTTVIRTLALPILLTGPREKSRSNTAKSANLPEVSDPSLPPRIPPTPRPAYTPASLHRRSAATVRRPAFKNAIDLREKRVPRCRWSFIRHRAAPAPLRPSTNSSAPLQQDASAGAIGVLRLRATPGTMCPHGPAARAPESPDS